MAKVRLSTLPLLRLGMLATGVIGLGAMFFTPVKSEPTLGFAANAELSADRKNLIR